MTSEIQLFNTLPTVLRHYEQECVDTLSRIGLGARPVAPASPADQKDVSRARRGLSHARAVLSARRRAESALVLWPTFGWLEPALWAASREPVKVVMHDPIAIRHQYGHGPLLGRLGKLALARGGVELICHTEEAADAAQESLGLKIRPTVMLHPILDQQSQTVAAGGTGIVLVAGEYKPSRDLELLASLGPGLRSVGLRPTIRGRGWPPVAGWEVVSTFVSNAEFEGALRAADVILVPYTRYWQSNVAAQALELNVPLVGLKTHFLTTLLGDDYPAFVSPPASSGEWRDAIDRAIAQPPDMKSRRARYEQLVDESWRAALGHT